MGCISLPTSELLCIVVKEDPVRFFCAKDDITVSSCNYLVKVNLLVMYQGKNILHEFLIGN
jgi:hypothetical protein